MIPGQAYFFCGVGGSGMTPLALIVQARGGVVEGSDRALDQGRNTARFDFLRGRGVALHPQDGSGLDRPGQTLVVSAAVEETIPDVQAARRLGAAIVTRAELLAELFNAAAVSVGVAGTSGKSTTTGMIGWILDRAGRDPTIMNGAEMKNFITAGRAVRQRPGRRGTGLRQRGGRKRRLDRALSADDRGGEQHLARPQVDGGAARAVRRLRRQGRHGRAEPGQRRDRAPWPQAAPAQRTITYSLTDPAADLLAGPPALRRRRRQLSGHRARHRRDGRGEPAGSRPAQRRQRPGRPRRGRAPAASAWPRPRPPWPASPASSVGSTWWATAGGVTVIDDFAHNPDKIAATLDTLHAFPGRLLVMFQPHGYGPLRLMKDAFVDVLRRAAGGRGRAAHARAGLFRRHHRSQRLQRRHHRRRSNGAAATPRPSPTARPAASGWSNWPGPATASWSWAPATIRCRYSRPRSWAA